MIIIDGSSLTIEQVNLCAKQKARVELAPAARQKMLQSKEWINQIVAKNDPVYGINTGFGIFSSKSISQDEIAVLNRNLILSHAVSTGAPLPDEVVRAAMLIRANTLAKGHSGASTDIVDTLLEMLNKDVVPVIPEQGSLGSSGDLSPLAHLSLVLTMGETEDEPTSGLAKYQGETLSGSLAMRKSRIQRIVIGAKESLALTNGATFSAALGCLAFEKGVQILKAAALSLAATMESTLAKSAAFDERIHTLRGQEGQSRYAALIRSLISESELVDSSSHVQDAYSIRCAPQIMGGAFEMLDYAETKLTAEINAVTDNPILFNEHEAVSGGNFHGEILAQVFDFLKISFSEVGAVSERRIYRLTDEHTNKGLPPMLVGLNTKAGLNSGMMMPQYTAVSLALENQQLSSPDSIHSMPTSGGKEDHNANSMTAGRNLTKIFANTIHILTVELFCALKALKFREEICPGQKPGIGASLLIENVKDTMNYSDNDTYWAPHIEALKEKIFDHQTIDQIFSELSLG